MPNGQKAIIEAEVGFVSKVIDESVIRRRWAVKRSKDTLVKSNGSAGCRASGITIGIRVNGRLRLRARYGLCRGIRDGSILFVARSD